MFHKIVEKFKTFKRLKIILIAVLMLVAVVVILIFATVSSGKWTKGGTYTKGPFRFRTRIGGAVEVRVDTRNLPEGTLVVETEDSGAVQTTDKGMKGKEQVYRITGDGSQYVDWILCLYADEEAQEKGQSLYELSLGLRPDDKKKFTIVSSYAEDIAPVESVETEEYELSWQQELGGIRVQINVPVQEQWYSEYDTKILRVEDIFNDNGQMSTIFNSVTDKDFDTSVCFYTLKNTVDNDDSHEKEIHLRVIGKEGGITEVKYE